jgi:hypothetical protein
MKSRIEEVECRIEEDLSKLRSSEYKTLEAVRECLIPQGYRVQVQLLDKKGRKKRKDASADSWTPDSGEIRIRFEPDPESSPKEKPTQPAVSGAPATSFLAGTRPSSDPMTDLLRSLDRAESKPGYDFVALKWFRDSVLPAEKFKWSSDSARQAVLREAIEKRLVLTSRVQNPKSPQFPVTAIRLNRLLPEVQKILSAGEVPASGFDPVDIRGERLSATVLRERR